VTSQATPGGAEAALLLPRRRAAVALGSVALSLALVLVCVFCVDARQVGQRLSAIDARWLLGFFVVYLLQIGLLGLRWSAISRQLGVPLGWRRASAEYALSVLMNNVLPTGFAGDGWRAVRHSSRCPKHSLSQILEVLAFDRVSGQVALIFVVLVGAPFAIQAHLLDPRVVALILVGGLSVLWFARRWVRRSAPERRMRAALRGFVARAMAVMLQPARAVVHLPLSLLLTSSLLLQLWLAARAAGIVLDFGLLFWLGPLIVLAASAPSFFGSWGVREGASALLFASAGLSSSGGVAVSLLFGTFSLVSALPGAIVMLFDGAPRALRGSEAVAPLGP
jgi:glycosyltransferase 2 family protein